MIRAAALILLLAGCAVPDGSEPIRRGAEVSPPAGCVELRERSGDPAIC